jgi:hypothetical protein
MRRREFFQDKDRFELMSERVLPDWAAPRGGSLRVKTYVDLETFEAYQVSDGPPLYRKAPAPMNFEAPPYGEWDQLVTIH